MAQAGTQEVPAGAQDACGSIQALDTAVQAVTGQAASISGTQDIPELALPTRSVRVTERTVRDVPHALPAAKTSCEVLPMSAGLASGNRVASQAANRRTMQTRTATQVKAYRALAAGCGRSTGRTVLSTALAGEAHIQKIPYLALETTRSIAYCARTNTSRTCP